MVFLTDFQKFPGVETLDQFERDNNGVTTSTVESTIFTSDARRIRDTLFNLYNTDAVNTITIKIFGSANGLITPPADADDSWFNILNVASTVTPANYDDTKSFVLPALGVWYESFTVQWAWVRITAKASAGTPIIKIWARSHGY